MKTRNGRTRGADVLGLSVLHAKFIRRNGPHAKRFVDLMRPALKSRKTFNFNTVLRVCKGKRMPGREQMRLFLAYVDTLWSGRRLSHNAYYSFPQYRLKQK
jgi:hypothetical protein